MVIVHRAAHEAGLGPECEHDLGRGRDQGNHPAWSFGKLQAPSQVILDHDARLSHHEKPEGQELKHRARMPIHQEKPRPFGKRHGVDRDTLASPTLLPREAETGRGRSTSPGSRSDPQPSRLSTGGQSAEQGSMGSTLSQWRGRVGLAPTSGRPVLDMCCESIPSVRRAATNPPGPCRVSTARRRREAGCHRAAPTTRAGHPPENSHGRIRRSPFPEPRSSAHSAGSAVRSEPAGLAPITSAAGSETTISSRSVGWSIRISRSGRAVV